MRRADPATRREFLATSAAAASTAALAQLDVARFAHAQGSGVIKVGMIGSGGRCTGAAEQALGSGKDVRLVALCDVFKERALGSLRRLKGKKEQVVADEDHAFDGLDGYKKVIECSDAVLIACASKFHPYYAKAAVEAGKHVFVEKPHGIDSAGCRLMAEACELAKQKKVSVMSGLQWRHHAGVEETIKRIHDGAIGRIVTIEENFLRAPYQVVRRKEGLKEVEYHFYNWYHFCWLSGDDVIQSLVHNVDTATWAMMGEAPVKCHGLGGRSASFGDMYGDMFDHHSVVYEYKDGARMYAHCRTQGKCYGDYSSKVWGTKGHSNLFNCTIEGATSWKYSGPGGNPYQIEHNRLFEAIRTGKPVNCGDYMVKSTLIGVMGQVACYTGQPVTYEQVEKSNFSFGPRPEEARLDMEPPTKPGPDGNYPLPVPGQTKLL
jgi:myo-inositol 2-dehydrogenase/D-chiro-inositol 1-dehydrogenase